VVWIAFVREEGKAVHGSVVIVDDDREMTRAIERLLKASGMKTTAFGSGEELLEANASAAADCLILDVNMPGLSGFELRSRLLALGVRTPVIFITAYDDQASRARAAASGAAGYLAKPFPSEALLAVLAGALQ
jgi:FixJ family two-component response regulator